MRQLKKLALVLLTLAAPCAAWCAAQPIPGGGVAPGEAAGTITGRILTKERVPLAGGVVYLFNKATGPAPAHEKYWRVPDYMKELDREGGFSLRVPEGGYYIGAVKRSSGRGARPPQEGDLFFTSLDGKGNPVLFTVRNGLHTDVGTLAGAAPFHQSSAADNGVTAVEGMVLNDEGKPVQNALVFAYLSAETVGRPLFISTPTGADGKFQLRVADSGSYFLKVRSVYGGAPPVAGEMVGTLGEKGPVPVMVKKGEKVQGVIIRVKKFAGRGPLAGTRGNVPPAQGVNNETRGR